MGGLLALSLSALVTPTAAADPVTPVDVITEDPFANATPPDPQLAYQLMEAEARAKSDPSAYGKPYIENGTVVAPVVRADMQESARKAIWLPSGFAPQDDGTGDPSSVPPPQDKQSVPATASSMRPEAKKRPEVGAASDSGTPTGGRAVYPAAKLVKRSWSQLEAIKDEAIFLKPDVLPDADKIRATLVQPALNRVIVEATEATDALRLGLAVRYGSDAVVIRVVPDSGPILPLARQNDTSSGGFYGGARIWPSIGGTCTSGFSWRVSGAHHMLTAGHCTSSGGTVSTPSEYMGTVVKDTWWNGHGTVLIDGQTTYRGDVSLIDLSGSKTSAGRIYVGSSTSASSRAVGAMWSRSPQSGDQYCTGGSTAGELCGWVVNAVGINVTYTDGTVIKNAVRGGKQGQCVLGGDSGGPVYTVNSAGAVIAKGIISGGGGGGSDNWGGAFDPCNNIFTDIWQAYYGLPGSLATS